MDKPGACDKAWAATEKAEDSGSALDHKAAAKAHDAAAKAAFKAGMPDVAKKHSKKAKGHKLQGVDPKKNPLAAALVAAKK